MLVIFKIFEQINRKTFLVIAYTCLFFNLSAQNDTVPKLYKDSTGNLFISKGTPIYFYMGTSTDPKKSIKLRSTANESDPIHWNGHGPKHLTYYNVFLGRRISFDLFTDALPPQTEIKVEKSRGYNIDNTIFLSGDCNIDLNSVDPDAGLSGVFYSINDGGKIKYSNPISLRSEGEYRFSVCAFDNVGNKEDEIHKTIVVDNTPPLTRLDFEGDNFENVVSGRSKLVLTSIDALGVKATFFCIDSGKITQYIKPIPTFSLPEGEHRISWYSIDFVENIELKKTSIFFVDKTPPMVFEEIIGSTYMVAGTEYSSGRSQLKIAAVDNKAGVKEIDYSLKQSDYVKYEKPVYLSDLLGTISIRSFAIDNVNNHSQSDIQSESFSMPVVDITGPQILFNFNGPKVLIRDTTWIGPRTNIKINSNDIGSGVNRIIYKIKGDKEKDYKEPFFVSDEGYHEIGFTAIDNVENVNLLSFGFGVDSKPPSIFYFFGREPIGWKVEDGERIPIYIKGTKLFLAATDNISGVDKILYTLDSDPELLYSGNISLNKSSKLSTLHIKAVDLLGNQSEQVVKFRVE